MEFKEKDSSTIFLKDGVDLAGLVSHVVCIKYGCSIRKAGGFFSRAEYGGDGGV